MSVEMPEDWPVVAIGSLTRVKRGASPRPIKDPRWFSDEGHGWVRISDVTASDRVLLQTTQYLSDAGKAASVEIVPGDLIMSICGTIGRPLFSGIHACIHDGFVAFKEIDKSRLDPTYLYFTLQAQTRHFEAQSQPGTQRNLNSALVGKTEIPLPPLAEQRRIAEVLRSVDEAIAAAQQAADHSRALQASLITAQCYGHGHEMVSLGDVLTDIRYGTSAKCDASEADGYPVLRIPNVVNGRVELDDLKYASVSDADLRRFSLEPDDIVVVRTNGNPAYIGRSALIAKGMMTCMFASYLIRMRFDERRAWSPYIYATLNSQPVREKLLKAATTSAGNYNINTASLKGITIPLPSLEVQHQIGEVIQAATEAATACENEVNSSQQVKVALMSDLLSGRVRVPS
ncbi:restriction endonuclease subunit S [Sphingopyxis granuli]|uniref:restriction endonuclease subunit S n=1 Tax=Sphingopyxis granuli TaxID=267128 RepID=UPI00083700B7|nr:restriction endonuclease subunit S [Sphingopyxis granuli]